MEGETPEPALAAGTRVSALWKLDVHGAGQLPVRDPGELRELRRDKALFASDVRAAYHEVSGEALQLALRSGTVS